VPGGAQELLVGYFHVECGNKWTMSECKPDKCTNGRVFTQQPDGAYAAAAGFFQTENDVLWVK